MNTAMLEGMDDNHNLKVVTLHLISISAFGCKLTFFFPSNLVEFLLFMFVGFVFWSGFLE